MTNYVPSPLSTVPPAIAAEIERLSMIQPVKNDRRFATLTADMIDNVAYNEGYIGGAIINGWPIPATDAEYQDYLSARVGFSQCDEETEDNREAKEESY